MLVSTVRGSSAVIGSHDVVIVDCCDAASTALFVSLSVDPFPQAFKQLCDLPPESAADEKQVYTWKKK